MCTEMETLAEFLLPCCMAAGCSPETKRITHFIQSAFLDGYKTSAAYGGLHYIHGCEKKAYERPSCSLTAQQM